MCDIITSEIRLQTGPDLSISDITGEVARELSATGLGSGIVTVFVPGATGALTTIEYEPGLVEDVETLLDRIIPPEHEYRHNLRWGDGNGHAHVRATLLGPSLTVPFTDETLCLGTWQQIIFLDFDPPARNRRLILQFMGKS